MLTIAGLVAARKLENLSAEKALEVLRSLKHPIESVDAEIDDEQADILLDIEEDDSKLHVYMAEVEKREEAERRRLENLKKATEAKAKKAAAKKSAAEKKTAAKKPAAKKAPAKRATKKTAETTEAEAVEAAQVTTSPEPELPAPVEAVIEEVAAAPAASTETQPVAPAAEVPEVKAKPVAEILPDVPPAPADTLAPEVRRFEIVRPAEHRKDEHGEPVNLLAEAERRHDEAERRRRERSTANPDPDVVAEVIRRAEEQKRQRERAAQRGADSGMTLRGRIDPSRMPKVRGAAAVQPGVVPGPPPMEGERPGDRGRRGGKAEKKKKAKRAEKARAMEETLRRDAAAAVREFVSGSAWGVGGKKRKKKSKRMDEMGADERQGGTIEVAEAMTVEQLSDAMGVGVNDVILALMDEDVLATKNQSIDIDLIRKVAAKFDFEVTSVIPEEDELLAETPDAPEDLVLRAPVVTVMGHVDHGKTSFLDAVRKANVVAGEAGGITQHIAAYDVTTPSGRVTFLDTPGHEAFTAMRARGSQITDVVVLVVAADDGVKPQTVEAIDHARAANVPIVVAINKCDKPGAQPDRVRQELVQYDLIDEQWGGSTVIKNISAHTREGIDELLEMLSLVAEMRELKANPKKPARGTVIEAELTKGLGITAWILVQRGTLRVGDVFLCGATYGRVRSMMSSRGEQITEAGPSTPVLVTGWDDMPNAGDDFAVVADERAARTVAAKRANLERQKRAAKKHVTLEDFHAQMLGRGNKTLNIIIKADVQGSVDVLESSFSKLGNEEANVSIVHSGVGGVNESDVMLASASDAVIIGFHVTANMKARKLAEQEGVEIRTYRIIYEALDEVKNALAGLLAPETREVIIGHAEVRQVFRSSALGNIAGCYQLDGETERGGRARLIRNDVVVYDGKIASLRRGKDDARSVAAGFECGIKLENYEDIQTGDIIESYRVESIAKTLA